MKAFCLVLLLVGSTMCVPQEVKESKGRQLALGQGQQAYLQPSPYGARLSQNIAKGAYFPGAYQQPQYYSGQQFAAYTPGAPAQAYYSGLPAQSYYPGDVQTPFKSTLRPANYQLAGAVPATPYRAGAFPATPYRAGAFPATPYSAAGYPSTPYSTGAFPSTPYRAAAYPSTPYKAAVNPQASAYSHNPYSSPFAQSVIVKQAQDDNFDGSFSYSYETDQGLAVDSTGFVKNAGSQDEVQVMQGSYTYYSPEGVPITTTYIADENGFQVQGDHLPVSPPLPAAIAKSIEYQRSLPPSPEEQEVVRQRV